MRGFHIATPMIQNPRNRRGRRFYRARGQDQLRVGPDSAGARPGPACYGRGGQFATVTDADVALWGDHRIRPLGGGKMKLDKGAAERAIKVNVADPLGLSVEAAAAGIRRIVDSQMSDTLREVTIGRGHDPRATSHLCLWRRRPRSLRWIWRRAWRAQDDRAGNIDGTRLSARLSRMFNISRNV